MPTDVEFRRVFVELMVTHGIVVIPMITGFIYNLYP
ncbi:hypothetical protein D2E25_1857 [Bifidobacterium goeldii]|uniref:Uncharacterized protein n=1 Tax=Bifidobacterium goeldii TaxID=2306975 RepID=A0A430FEY5_9BIFI|nr:hypothetical protein D2E25_1857 [Bifidobacterium goeldii]